MNCPVCKKPMIVMELDQVEIDHCIECNGIWLDSGELELLLEGAEGKDSLLNSFKENKNVKESWRKCPICLKKMIKVLAGEPQGAVLIDKCKNNHGLWFDSKELMQIILMGSLGKDNRVISLLKEMFSSQKQV